MGVISQYRTDRLVERLVAQDNANSPEAREIIGKLRRDPAEAVARLLERLQRNEPAVFRNAAAGLYRLLDDDTLEHYFAGLKSSNPRTVGAVAQILSKNRRYRPDRLLPLFEDARVPKARLIEVLSQQRDRLDPEQLLRYAGRLEAADHNALFQVIEALATPALVPGLVSRATAADPSIRAHVVRMLGHFPDAADAAHAVVDALADTHRNVRLAAIEVIGASGIRPSIAQVAPLLRDPDLAIQARAIDAVIRLRDPQTMDYLTPVLRDESEYVRRAGVEVLNEIADAELIGDLLGVLGDDDWWVRERAADALSRIGGPRVIDAMLQLIRSEDEFVRRTAIEVINTSRDPRAYEHLLTALTDADWWVKERAIDALAALGKRDAVPHLLRVLERDERARPTALRALAALGDPRALEPAITALEDADKTVRLEALRALESLTEPDNAETVIEAIEAAMASGTSTFRDQARGVIGNIRARCLAAERSSDDGAEAGTATLIARPGETPQRLSPGTRLDLAGMTPGTVLDRRYRFIERVGHGAFGTVMRFEDTTVSEEIIVKFLNEQVSDDPRVSKRFVQELRYARRVTHPNVIRIYDFLRIGGLYAISMEYFPGFPLTREMLQDQPMRTDRALRLVREITFGMAAAHRSGVVHRDLKPANILMSHVDQVKIVDFGIAAAAFRDPDETEITQTGDFVGTPAYTSPEQIRGQGVDARTDIYSLGVVMYRMLAGRLPYQEKERRKLLMRHLEGHPPPLTELNPALPDGLAEVVAKAMAVDPQQRHQSMDEFREATEQFL